MTLSKLTFCALAAASISLTMVGCSEEPVPSPSTVETNATYAEDHSPEEQNTDMSAIPDNQSSSTEVITIEDGEGPAQGVIINDDLMVEEGYAQTNP